MNNILEIQSNKIKETVGKHVLADGFDFVMDIENSHGSWIHDSVSGKNFLF